MTRPDMLFKGGVLQWWKGIMIHILLIMTHFCFMHRTAWLVVTGLPDHQNSFRLATCRLDSIYDQFMSHGFSKTKRSENVRNGACSCDTVSRRIACQRVLEKTMHLMSYVSSSVHRWFQWGRGLRSQVKGRGGLFFLPRRWDIVCMPAFCWPAGAVPQTTLWCRPDLRGAVAGHIQVCAEHHDNDTNL